MSCYILVSLVILCYIIYIYIHIYILYISIYLSSTFISRLNHEVHGVRIHMFGEDDWLIWLAIEHSHWWLIPYSWPAVSMAISSQSHATYSAVHVISAHNLGLAGWLDFVSCPKKLGPIRQYVSVDPAGVQSFCRPGPTETVVWF